METNGTSKYTKFKLSLAIIFSILFIPSIIFSIYEIISGKDIIFSLICCLLFIAFLFWCYKYLIINREYTFSEIRANSLKSLSQQSYTTDGVLIVGKLQKIRNTKEMKGYLDSIMEYLSLNPKYIPEIIEKGKSLGLREYATPEAVNTTLKYNLDMWNIDNGKFPNYDTDFILKEGERCLYSSDAQIFNIRNVIDRVNYGGPRVHIKLMKGISYNFGTYSGSTSNHSELQMICEGKINLTNRRLLFKSASKNIDVDYSKIDSLDSFEGMLSISKGNVKPLIINSNDNNIMYHTLVWAINNK